MQISINQYSKLLSLNSVSVRNHASKAIENKVYHKNDINYDAVFKYTLKVYNNNVDAINAKLNCDLYEIEFITREMNYEVTQRLYAKDLVINNTYIFKSPNGRKHMTLIDVHEMQNKQVMYTFMSEHDNIISKTAEYLDSKVRIYANDAVEE